MAKIEHSPHPWGYVPEDQYTYRLVDAQARQIGTIASGKGLFTPEGTVSDVVPGLGNVRYAAAGPSLAEALQRVISAPNHQEAKRIALMALESYGLPLR